MNNRAIFNIFKKVSFIFLSLFIGHFSSAYAGVGDDLTSFFNNMGLDSNVTPPGAYKGQEAGYYTGGSLYARTRVRDLQIMQMTVPSYRSGCGGIDLFTGGFSFIDSEHLIEMFKDIMNNAKSFAFTLALESATPMINNVIKFMQEQAAKINSMNINSCETAAALVGSVWPRTQEAQRKVCADIGNSNGIFTDYAQSKQKCGNAGEFSSTMAKAQGAKKNMVFDQGNLAWKAIQQNDFLKKDPQLAKLFMSLSGTIIVRKSGSGDDAENDFIHKPSLATNTSLLRTLLNGGKATIYGCQDHDECLNVEKTVINIDAEHSLKKLVNKTLQSMAEKFTSDTAISSSDKGLMEATTLPIQKMLNVQMAFYKEKEILDITSYTDIVALDILFQYLNENLNVVRASAINLHYSDDIMGQFIKGIDDARKELRKEQSNAYAEITTVNSIVKQTKMIEELLSSSYSEHMNLNMKWAKGEL